MSYKRKGNKFGRKDKRPIVAIDNISRILENAKIFH